MTTWTDGTPEARNKRNLQKAIKGAQKLGMTPPREFYIDAGLTPPKKATDEFQQPSLWRKMINFWRPVW
ncbi:hypothetical protein Q0N40_00100 [Corynebacterium pseudokroppenstedtii]|uniref:Uncharacterized protein n=1 Tax=Corynebacterium pseudokroppenstedtii TaxID=2804917 RepID=A0AAU0PX34_9CORY|nr:hypothetical protein [Corynebacterium pseudokroppenstedtii]MDU6478267.1 hypothetical protein [Corynebacterium kroppenstedtii]MBY0790577.1 hypothetical protein [Corynebacterium pseudokroppenstedtii]MCF6792882.1 hypothetical protein [Corynebacterium pseudokroppenstedtii]MCF8702327.1 hypothetical protein [Corynebacterium pseudokroppenstedtii]MCG2635532.1 hypothetical protein [Corynebacterium pseudokroppenstedtii]